MDFYLVNLNNVLFIFRKIAKGLLVSAKGGSFTADDPRHPLNKAHL